MTTKKSAVTIDGETHYSLEAAAKLLSMTPKKLKASMIDWGLDWTNYRDSVRIWIPARSVVAFQKKMEALAAKGQRSKVVDVVQDCSHGWLSRYAVSHVPVVRLRQDHPTDGYSRILRRFRGSVAMTG